MQPLYQLDASESLLHRTADIDVMRTAAEHHKSRLIIKRLRAQPPRARALQKFLAESRVLKHLSDTGVAGVPRVVLETTGPKHYIRTTVDVGGYSLRSLVEERPLSVEDVVFVAQQICATLGNVHGVRVVHRGITPDHIIFNPQQRDVELVSFGRAQLLATESQYWIPLESLRSPLVYLAPEQLGHFYGGPIDARCDLYALGITLFELLTRQLPFDADNAWTLGHEIMHGAPRRLLEVAPRCPPALAALVDTLLAKRADDRPPSAAAVGQALVDILHRDAAVAPPPPVPQRPPSACAASLQAAYLRAVGGTGELVLLSGGDAADRAKMVRGLVARSAVHQSLFAAGRYEGACITPFGALRDALDGLLTTLDTLPQKSRDVYEQHIRAAVHHDAGSLCTWLAPLRLWVTAGGHDTDEPLHNEQRLLLLWQRLLAALGSVRPLIVYVDNLHQADYGMLRLLRLLNVEGTPRAGLLLICGHDRGVRDSHLDALAQQLSGGALKATTLRLLADDMDHDTPYLPWQAPDVLEQHFLSTAAHVGHRFAWREVCAIAQVPHEVAWSALGAAMEAGLVRGVTHAYTRLPALHSDVSFEFDDALARHRVVAEDFAAQASTHRAIREALALAPHRCIEAAYHAAHVADGSNTEQTARLCLLAARFARAGAAYDIGCAYVDLARILVDTGGVTDTSIDTDIAYEAVGNLLLLGDRQGADAVLLAAATRSDDSTAYARVFMQRITCDAQQTEWTELLRLGTRALPAFGVPAIKRVSLWRQRLQMAQLLVALRMGAPTRGRTAVAPHAQVDTVMRCLHALSNSAAVHEPSMCDTLAIVMVRWLLRAGPSAYDAYAFAALAATCARWGWHASATAAGKRALATLGPTSEAADETLYWVQAHAVVRRLRPAQVRAQFIERYDSARRHGDLFTASAAGQALLRGEAFRSVRACLRHLDSLVKIVALGYVGNVTGWMGAVRQMCLCLLGATSSSSSFDSSHYSEFEEETMLRQGKAQSGAPVYYFLKTVALWVHGHTILAAAAAEAAHSAGAFEVLSFEVRAQYALFSGLSLVARARLQGLSAVPPSATLSASLTALRRVAARYPDTHQGFPLLLNAELAALRGDAKKAVRCFENAVVHMRRADQVAFAAAAHECAARYYESRGMRAASQLHFNGARDAYTRWGAAAKVGLLSREQRQAHSSVPKTIANVPAAATPRVDVQALMQSAQTLLEQDDAKTQFFSRLSGEFRDPLTWLLTALDELLAVSALPDTLRNSLTMCRRNGLRLLRLSDDLFKLSQLEAAHSTMLLKPLHPGPLLADWVAQVQPLAHQKGVTLTFEFEGDALTTIHGDADELQGVVLNLLSNALKFTPPGGHIQVAARVDERLFELTVHDTGIGIPKAALGKIFERFYQVERESARAPMGTGLGLALCKRIIELHGGDISAVSEAGQGTLLRVVIPLDTADAQPMMSQALPAPVLSTPAPVAAGWHEAIKRSAEYRLVGTVDTDDLYPVTTPAPAHMSDAARKVVLVVEDNAQLRSYVASILSKHYHVRVAEDGQAGLDAALESPPDFILTDWMMPRLTGVQMVDALRHSPITRAIPVVMLTAKDEVRDRIHARDAQVDSYLAKPFTAQSLLRAIEGLDRRLDVQRATTLQLRGVDLELFMAGVCHEILNPLGFIRSGLFLLAETYEDLLKASTLPAEAVTANRAAAHAARAAGAQAVGHIRQSVDKLRQYARHASAVGPRQGVAPAAIVDNVQRLVRPMTAVQTTMRTTHDVHVSPGQIEHVLTQLILAMHHSEVTVSCDEEAQSGRVRLTVARAQGAVPATVEGVESEHEGGHLRVAMSREILRAQGGELHIDDDATGNRRYSIFLPPVVLRPPGA